MTSELEWVDLSSTRKIGQLNGFVVYSVQRKHFEGPGPDRFSVFHRLPVAAIEKTFRSSDEAKLFADAHLRRAMSCLGYVPR